MLIDLKQYIKNQRSVSLSQLVNNFPLDPMILHNMLNFLMQKGNIRKKSKTDNCGSKCSKCHPSVTEIYEWIP